MSKKLGILFFLIGFLFFSFSGSICLLSKMKSQDLAQMVGNIAEEEDETERDSKSGKDIFLEDLEHLPSNSSSITKSHLKFISSELPQYLADHIIQPPEFLG